MLYIYLMKLRLNYFKSRPWPMSVDHSGTEAFAILCGGIWPLIWKCGRDILHSIQDVREGERGGGRSISIAEPGAPCGKTPKRVRP
jgi:hypothetical protein